MVVYTSQKDIDEILAHDTRVVGLPSATTERNVRVLCFSKRSFRLSIPCLIFVVLQLGDDVEEEGAPLSIGPTLQKRYHSLAHSLIHSLTLSLTHSLSRSLTHLLTHSLIHSLTHSLTHSHSLSHSLTHSLVGRSLTTSVAD